MIGRRRFLLQGFAASAGLLAGLGRAGAQEAPLDVIVIGAGLAGLACARDLVAAGKKVVILEARRRLGGRVWTSQQLGYPVDLGASWLHGIKNNPLYPVATQNAGLRTVPTNYEDMVTFGLDAQPWSLSRTRRAENWLDAFVSNAERRGSVSTPVSRLVPARVTADQDFELVADVVHEVGADLDRIASKYPQGDGKDLRGADLMVPAGLDGLVSYLSTGLDVRLGQNVRSVKNGKTGVSVVTSSGVSYKAKQLCCTVPLGVLQARSIRFDPPLPAVKTTAIRRLGMGLLEKIILQFPSAFWDPRQLIRNDSGDGLWAEWYNLAPVIGRPVLMGFNAASVASRVAGQSDRVVVAGALAALQRCYPGKTIPAPSASVITRWGRDPFAMGSYSFMQVGSSPAYRAELGRPWGSVVFAGEASSVDFPATMQGAYVSGQRAAKQLLGLVA